MNSTSYFILIAIFAWILQILLSWWQLQKFNNAMLKLIKAKYIGVGRSQSSRFKPKVIIVLSINENFEIVDTILMSGLTVFSAPKKLDKLHGLSIKEIDPIKIFPNNQAYQNAFKTAIQNK